jgi:hypothetical protein
MTHPRSFAGTNRARAFRPLARPADAHDRIEARRASDALTADEAEKLHGFVDDDYLTTSLGLDEALCDALATLWQRRPADLAVSPHVGRPRSFADYEGPVRQRGYRIPDLHGIRHGLWPSIGTRRSFAWWS